MKSKEERKAERMKKPLWKRILNGIGTGLVVVVVGIVVVFGIASLTAQTTYGVKVIFNHALLVVLTDSMEPTYPVGSAVFIEKVDAKDIKVVDDLTFYYDDLGMTITHRVSNISENNGIYTFTLHGINTKSTQCGSEDNPQDCTDQTQVVTYDKVVGKVVGSSLAFGKFYSFMTTPWGLVIILLIPGGYLIFVSISTIIKTLKEKDDEDKLEVTGPNGDKISIDSTSKNEKYSSLSEEDKKRLKQDLLNEMLKNKEGGNKDDK